VVLYKFAQKFLAAPISSFDGNGIGEKSDAVKRELVQLEPWVSGVAVTTDRLWVEEFQPFLDRESWVMLSSAFSVDYKADVRSMGALRPTSQTTLFIKCNTLIKNSG
jgi:hypothetical protein